MRQTTRPRHLEYLGGFAGHIKWGGPMLDDTGETAVGSLLLVDFPDRAAAEALIADDPYSKAGLFESVVVRRARQIIPSP
ncbi:MAG: YciI family protein [Alphaproteobacteria bacterium]|nr:YciI family protein [Alphaproteobacteria bacterium]